MGLQEFDADGGLVEARHRLVGDQGRGLLEEGDAQALPAAHRHVPEKRERILGELPARREFERAARGDGQRVEVRRESGVEPALMPGRTPPGCSDRVVHRSSFPVVGS
ncbi:hypothetical protein GCM10023205_81430 [Yinghuangia aomiensis]|uniref:Uncharacterized protein n=1 Tax=Yinghuangia aomiensis TaxID=676205 RepID=A0ABP9IGT1_9ACTN